MIAENATYLYEREEISNELMTLLKTVRIRTNVMDS